MAPSALGCILLAQACCFALAKQLADIYWNSTNPKLASLPPPCPLQLVGMLKMLLATSLKVAFA
ncbi:hypothetical protein T08_9386 [Trichinella sp. T8]|uniref:Secreted protein n=1 Tax=Trichinella murrelli TaxID=144512 RepID=A0A0V0UBH4_9BILA|nr:hypothetical protein T05_4090 [Trichinella murrelli]KRZ90126.1 hypothetical protein T08_9386 [Trichinella sp. T8]